jgi:hypothetical protein
MSDTPTKIIVDCSTGVVAEVPLTGEEIAQREADAVAYEAQKALDDAATVVQEDAKAALLKKLGITQEEATLLLS